MIKNNKSKNAIVSIVNNYELFKAQLSNLPNKLDSDFLVCLNNKNIHYETIRDLVGPDIAIIDIVEVVSEFANSLDYKDFIQNIEASAYVLLPSYIFKTYEFDKVLFVDDNILLLEDICEIFSETKSSYYKYASKSNQVPLKSTKSETRLKEFDKIFGTNSANNPKIATNYQITNSIKYLVRDDFNLYEYDKKLKEFLTNEIIHFYYNEYINKFEARSFLSKFEGFFTYILKYNTNNLFNYVVIETGRIKNTNFNKYKKLKRNKKYMWYNSTSEKINWIRELRESGYIK